MKMFEVRLWNVEVEQPDQVDWVPEHELPIAQNEAYNNGLRFKVIREVPWQEQLARMDNNPE